MHIPLHASWLISGNGLPERMRQETLPDFTFRLPGTDALAEFAELIGSAPAETAEPAQPAGAPFALPALIPEDASGEIELTREVDFSSVSGHTARLEFDMLCGQGTVTLKSLPPRFVSPGAPGAEEIILSAAFKDGPLELDVTTALLARRRFTLTLCFSDVRPAGVCGPVMLHTARDAQLARVLAEPDSESGTLTISADIRAFASGGYTLRAQLCPAQAPASPEDMPPIREIALQLAAGETRSAELSMAAECAAFTPGKAYAAPALKLQLLQTAFGGLCDNATLMCGFPGAAPDCWLPLTQNDLQLPPEQLLCDLQALHVTGVSLPAPAPDMLYRLFTRSGIGIRHSLLTPPEDIARLRRYPCVTFHPEAPCTQQSPAFSAWRLCGLTTYPRPAEPGVTDVELLRDAFGREADPSSPDIQAVLAWLRAFSLRLRAEAMRQGKLSGALCTPGEFHQPDAAQAIGTAFAPIHLSALPLCGAWWTGSRFSATLRAFIPKDVLSVDKSIRAVATLEDADSHVIARAEFPCAPWRSQTGLLEATLPDAPCVLELVTRLYADDAVLEESSMPVYVGERGMLEAAL